MNIGLTSTQALNSIDRQWADFVANTIISNQDLAPSGRSVILPWLTLFARGWVMPHPAEYGCLKISHNFEVHHFRAVLALNMDEWQCRMDAACLIHSACNFSHEKLPKIPRGQGWPRVHFPKDEVSFQKDPQKWSRISINVDWRSQYKIRRLSSVNQGGNVLTKCQDVFAMLTERILAI